MTAAANDDRFTPAEVRDDPFMAWALRVMLRLRNVPPGASEQTLRRALFSEGTPSPEWAGALRDMLLTAKTKG